MKINLKGSVDITIYASISKVWEALTTPDLIKKYFFNSTVISDWKEGSSIIFKGEWKGEYYEDKGIILNIIPDKLFSYNYWNPMLGLEDKPENYVIVTYELTESGDTTHLTIILRNIPDEKTKIRSEDNWKKVLGELKKMLEKESIHSV